MVVLGFPGDTDLDGLSDPESEQVTQWSVN